MFQKNLLYSCAVGISLLMNHNPSQAVDKFSRACNFALLPSAAKLVAAKFLVAMGAPASKATLHQASELEQYKHSINESLTTDYFRARYYLFASARVYAYIANSWKFTQKWDSRWSAEEVLSRIRTDPTFSPHYANRGAPFYNARAGDPAIYTVEDSYHQHFVVGRHYYYDPTNGAMVDFGETQASSCNTSEIGQYGIFNR